MRFRTKWELLEYLGKDKKYVRLIDRMMVKGAVTMVDWEYEYNDPIKEEVNMLKERIQQLEEQVEWLKKEKWELVMQIISSGEESSENEVVEKVYQYMTKVLHLRVNHDEYIEWIENN